MKADNEQWSEWIAWFGGVCPVSDGTLTEIKCKAGSPVVTDRPESYVWGKDVGGGGAIAAYRFRHGEESLGISDAAEEEALQEAYERIKQQDCGYEIVEVNRKLAGLSADKAGLQLLCVQQQDEINRLKSQLRRIREMAGECK